MSEASNMARQHETEISFSDTWGGKIEHVIFKTVRGQDKVYKVGQVYPCTLIAGLFHKKTNLGMHELLGIEWKRIRDFTTAEVLADIGQVRAGSEPKREFLEILKAFYSKKGWWDGEYTIMQRLTLEKIRQRSAVT